MARLFLLNIFLLFCIGNISASDRDKVNIQRLDKDLLQYLNNPNSKTQENLLIKYPQLLPALGQTISNTSNQKTLFSDLERYFAHPVLWKIYQTTTEQYTDMGIYEKELSEIILVAKNKLNISKVPIFCVHVSGFKENTIYVNNNISLSLDKYLGDKSPTYTGLGYFTASELQQMKPELIVRDLTKAWLMADYIKIENTAGNLLSEMIEQGKLIYALQELAPNYKTEELLNYTEEEYDWCINNTEKVWKTITKKNHLYTEDKQIINLYLGYNSNTEPILKGVPKQVGAWIGYKIVTSYAKASKRPLKDILATDYQVIFKGTK